MGGDICATSSGKTPETDPLPKAGKWQYPSSWGLFPGGGGGDFHTSVRIPASPEATSSGREEGQCRVMGAATQCSSLSGVQEHKPPPQNPIYLQPELIGFLNGICRRL